MDPEHLRRIVDLQVEILGRRLAARRIDVDLTDTAKDWLAEHGFDPAYGTRPLKRLIQKEIGDRLATALLDGTISEGSTVPIDAGADGLAITT